MQTVGHKTLNPTRGMADLNPVERREIVEKAIKRHTSQVEIAAEYGVKRSVIAAIVHQHRKATAGGQASVQRSQMLAGAPVTIRRFSWEGAEA